ncbi:MAG: hypothetical protein ABR598_08680 [Candidatus Dormibacteria bacterium]
MRGRACCAIIDGIEQLYVITPDDSAGDSASTVPGGRPPDTATIDELAAYWATHQDELREFSSWLYRVRRRLSDAVRDGGPIITPTGRVTLEAAGYEYPPEIAHEFPGLGHHVVSAVVDTVEQAERILDLVTEEVPSAEVTHELKVDGRAASRLIHQGGAAAKRLLDLRVPKGRLSVH